MEKSDAEVMKELQKQDSIINDISSRLEQRKHSTNPSPLRLRVGVAALHTGWSSHGLESESGSVRPGAVAWESRYPADLGAFGGRICHPARL